jgi:hypothetical protein
MRSLFSTTLTLAAVALCTAASLMAGTYVPPSPRPPYPDDYKPVPCAPVSCESFNEDDLHSAAYSFLGLNVNAPWFQAHEAELRDLITPFCKKRNTCMATPGNVNMFCDDLVTPEIRTICGKKYSKPEDAKDLEQCQAWVETWALGMTQKSYKPWLAAQECAKPYGVMHTQTPDVWMAPASIPSDYTGYLTFFAIDRDTHVPVFGHISGWEGNILYAPSNPTGETATYYPFQGPFQLVRVPRPDGHTDIAGPMLTMKFDFYPAMTFRMAIDIPKLTVTVEKDPKYGLPGKHEITVKALDAVSGKPVELVVMAGTFALGPSNTTLSIDRKKGEKLPEIWVTSLFNRYSDLVVAPAEK